ncbi:MAG TPA: ribosome silencing factor [Phnomibacter sp.]|nr:ribosome silencing factor [Phnomibacter sp.]
MKQTEALPSGRRPIQHLTRQSRLFKSILKGIFDKKGEEVISLDLRKIPEASADFFVICEASNANQVKAIADSIQERVKTDTEEIPYHQEGFHHAKWVLVDYVNVVVHIMQPESRRFYQLEEMWSDAPAVQHEPS